MGISFGLPLKFFRKMIDITQLFPRDDNVTGTLTPLRHYLVKKWAITYFVRLLTPLGTGTPPSTLNIDNVKQLMQWPFMEIDVY